MTFEEFREYIEEHILEGWKEDFQISVHKVCKNNGVVLHGLNIRAPEEMAAPTIYLEDYYAYYLKGEDLEEILGRIREEYVWAVSKMEALDFDTMHYGYVRDHIIYRLVNYEKNREILEECPHIRLHDLAITFRWLAHSDEIGISTALITKRELENWNVTASELLVAAQENTERLFPAQIMTMPEMMQQFGLPFPISNEEFSLYIMTNRQKVNGATVLLYDDILKDFAREKESDFYILPSSIHEVLLVPEAEVPEPSALKGMVRDANETVVSLGDILSDSVYYYDRGKNRLSPLTK